MRTVFENHLTFTIISIRSKPNKEYLDADTCSYKILISSKKKKIEPDADHWNASKNNNNSTPMNFEILFTSGGCINQRTKKSILGVQLKFV